MEKEIEYKLKLLFHTNSLKTLKPSDEILVHSGFYHTCGYHKIHMITGDYIYLKDLAGDITRFSIFDGTIVKINEKILNRTYVMENYSIALNTFSYTIKLPIFEIKYQKKKTEKDIPKNDLCYSIEEETVCPHLSKNVNGYFKCGLIKETFYKGVGDDVNSRVCRTDWGKNKIKNSTI